MITLEQALATGHGQWRSFTCPIHDDRSPSARVNVATGKWVCMSCGARGKADAVVSDLRLEFRYLVERLDARPAPKPESWLDQFDAAGVHPYWLSRFSEATARRYRLGYDLSRGRPCYPVRDEHGQPLGVTHRNLSDDGPKYRYPKGVVTSHYLFGAHELDDPDVVVLVEGATAALALADVGVPAVGSYGSVLHRKQAMQLTGVRKVLVAYDEDKAGRKGAADAVLQLKALGMPTVRVRWDGDRWNDPGDMDPATRSEIFSQALASIPSF